MKSLQRAWAGVRDHLLSRWHTLRTVYAHAGALKSMLWISLMLMVFQALWTGVVLSSLGAFLQLAFASLKGNSNAIGNTPTLVKPLMAFFLALPESQRLYLSFGIMGLNTVLASLIKIGVFAYQSLFSTRFITAFRKKVFSLLCHSPMSFFDTNKKGELIQMVINESRAHFTVLRSLLDMAANIFNVLVILVFAVALSWKLCLIVFSVWLLLLLESFYMGKTIRALARYTKSHLRQLVVLAEEGIGGIKHIKLLNYTPVLIEKFAHSTSESEYTDRHGNILVQSQEAISFVGALLSLYCIVWINVHFHLLSTAALVLFMYVLYRVIPPITAINQDLGYIDQCLPLAEPVNQFVVHAERTQEIGGAIVRPALLREAIEFRGISLDYENRKNVLKNVSFAVARGQTVALVGPSGSGKTSLANLLVRLYVPSAGNVFIDGTPINELDLVFLRSRIGMVHQETSIFNMTVRENLLVAKPDATPAELEEATRLAYADEFIGHLPQGYDTLLGDRGVQLSGGQRQRIQLAQIFLKNPEILILDEATSALDAKSEQYIQEALRRLAENRTTLIIAHRLSTIRHADRIVVIEGGHKIEEGNWTSLLQTKGRFAELVQHQSVGLVDDLVEAKPAADPAL